MCVTILTIPRWSQAGYQIQGFRIDDELYELYAPTDAVDELQLALDDLMQARTSDTHASVRLEDDTLRITLDTYDPSWNMAMGKDSDEQAQEFPFVSDCSTANKIQDRENISQEAKENHENNAQTIEQKQNCITELDQLCIEKCTDNFETCEQRCTICTLGENIVRDDLDRAEENALSDVILPVISDEGEQIGMHVTEELTFIDTDEPARQMIIPQDTIILNEDGDSFQPTDMVIAPITEAEILQLDGMKQVM